MNTRNSIPLQLDLESGLVTPSRLVLSPNHNQRPTDMQIDTLIVHAISLPPRCYDNDYIEHLFTNCLDIEAHPYFAKLKNIEVSAHFLIKRSGELIQFVPTHLQAWHAGKSNFDGRENVNGFSIGVELEGCDEHPFEDAQYTKLAEVAALVMNAYPGITSQRVVGHSDIAPDRKTDPGPHFDWERLHSAIADADAASADHPESSA